MEAADIAIGILFVVLGMWLLTRWKHAAERAGHAARAVKRATRAERVRPHYEWEPRTDRYRRQLKGVPRQAEDRDAIPPSSPPGAASRPTSSPEP